MLADRMRMSFRNLLGKLNITIDHTKIDSTLTDYPVMVKLDEINFDFSKIREDGKGIRFKDSNGNYLAHEVEYFTTNKAIFHIKVPIVSSTVDTKISMEYSLAYETDYSDKTNVWDSNFVMVQHMGESLVDSTGNGNDGTNYGTTVVDGLNGKARSFDGVNDNILIGDKLDMRTGDWTLQSLNSISGVQSTGTTYVFSKSYAGVGHGRYGLGYTTTRNPRMFTSADDIDYSYNSPIVTALNTPNLISGVWNRISTFNLFYNDSKEIGVSISSFSTSDMDSTYPARIGSYTSSDRISPTGFFKGTIEELRISNIARSDAWIKADDYNLRQNNLITIE